MTILARGDQRAAGRTRFVATGSDTAGDYGLFEVEMPPGGHGPDAHLHHTISESFHILEGQLAILHGREWITASAGDLVYVPKDGVHGFSSAGPDVGARFLILFTPGLIPREEYFEGLLALRAGGRTPSTAEIDEFAARYDQINLRGATPSR
jgi:mannose-6-phosphate isomerase-like protein (cupin superfamily)